jgi:hypothetical protein
MSKNRTDDDDDDLMGQLFTRATLGPTFFWLVIWAICNFNPWVGFGLFFAWGGSVGLFNEDDKRKRRRRREQVEDDRGFSLGQGGQSAPTAVTDQSENTVPPLPLHKQVIAEAAPARTRLEAAASVADGALGTKLRNMLTRVKAVEAGLETDPSRLSDVQRLFTYYLPATADLLSARGAIAGSGDIKRLEEIDTMIGKLDLAFTDFGDRLQGHDARSLEIDMRLLDQALDSEFALKTKG